MELGYSPSQKATRVNPYVGDNLTLALCAIRIKGAYDEPAVNFLQALARNHMRRPPPLRITIHDDETHSSHLNLPITRGNIIGGRVRPESVLYGVSHPLAGRSRSTDVS